MEHTLFYKNRYPQLLKYLTRERNARLFLYRHYSKFELFQNIKDKNDGNKRSGTNPTWRKAQLKSQYLATTKTKQKLGHKIK